MPYKERWCVYSVCIRHCQLLGFDEPDEAYNAKKCKELRVCFIKATPQLPPLRIDGQVLETVRSHKVLGLVIQDNLKWNENTCMIVSMASKRLHIIRVLRRGGVSVADLLVNYLRRSRTFSPRVLFRGLA